MSVSVYVYVRQEDLWLHVEKKVSSICHAKSYGLMSTSVLYCMHACLAMFVYMRLLLAYKQATYAYTHMCVAMFVYMRLLLAYKQATYAYTHMCVAMFVYMRLLLAYKPATYAYTHMCVAMVALLVSTYICVCGWEQVELHACARTRTSAAAYICVYARIHLTPQSGEQGRIYEFYGGTVDFKSS